MVKSFSSRTELLGPAMGVAAAKKTTRHKANKISRKKKSTDHFRIPRERGQLKTGYKFGRIGRISNLCISKKGRGKEEIREKKNVWRKKSSSDGNSSFLNDMLVYEILPRLPSKSLMRFKSTCKLWLSLIQHDPHFHDSHFNYAGTRPSQLILLLPIEDKRLLGIYDGIQLCSFSADLDQGRASVDVISGTRSFGNYSGILNPVNGLICFFNTNGSICIYNLGTREITPWICSTFILNNKNEFNCPTYGFGFDPITTEHKVICMWRRKLPSPYVACEILTVGHNKWRRVDDVQLPYEFDHESSVYVNGSIYWICGKVWFCEWHQENFDPQVIIAFDVGSEKFRTTSVPNFILSQHCDGHHAAGLLEVDGRVALFRRMDDHTVKMWTYVEDHVNKNKKNISTSNTNWSEETIKLPFCWNRVAKLTIHGVTGSDQLIIRYVRSWQVSLYSYNRKNQSFKKVEISGISSIWDPTYSLFAPFLESLFPVGSNGTPTRTLDLESKPVKKLSGPIPFYTKSYPNPIFPWN